MAYQQVSVPRFYCNVVEWLMKTGVLDLAPNLDPSLSVQTYMTLPVNYILAGGAMIDVIGMTKKSFIAILGHKLSSAMDGVYYHLIYDKDGSSENFLYTQVLYHLLIHLQE